MKKMIFMLLAATVVSCSEGVKPGLIEPKSAASWVAQNDKVQILDVRRPDEYAEGYLKGATLVTWGEAGFVESAKQALKPNQPVLVYCRSGRRSGLAMAELKKAGFSDVRSLVGGITAWQKAGNPVITQE